MNGNERFIDTDGVNMPLRDALAQNYVAVFAFLRKLSGDEETARDLTQDVMVKAILRFRSFRGAASFKTWLLAIAANLYRDGLRKCRPLSLSDVRSDTQIDADDFHDGGREADLAGQRLDAERAWELLAELPLKKRKALVLRLEFGYSYEEIARILACPTGTVRSRIHEAIEALRKAMGVSHENRR